MEVKGDKSIDDNGYAKNYIITFVLLRPRKTITQQLLSSTKVFNARPSGKSCKSAAGERVYVGLKLAQSGVFLPVERREDQRFSKIVVFRPHIMGEENHILCYVFFQILPKGHFILTPPQLVT